MVIKTQTLPDIVGTVAAITESEPDATSEISPHGILGQPGQRHEAGKAFDCSV